MHFPRILIVTSNNFNLVTGGGITLTNLFRGWPVDRIANLHEDSHLSDTTVCRRFYRLTNDEIRLPFPFSMIAPATNGGGPLASGSEIDKPAVKISRIVFGDGIPRTFRFTDALTQWLDEFRPEVVYSFLGSVLQIRVVAGLTKHYRAKLAIHIMDDWPAVIYRHGVLAPVLRHSAISEFQTLLCAASVRLAICDDMCHDYRDRFGFDFLPFHNAIETDDWYVHGRHSWKPRSPFVVRYAGSILEGAQQDALRDICIAVGNLNRVGHAIEMWIHAPLNQRSYLSGLNVQGLHLSDSPDPQSITNLLSSADLLVLPFNFDQSSVTYMRLSMPTKIPAYMASGTPILVYGPTTIAPVRYAENFGWGQIVSQVGVGGVEDAIRTLMRDEQLREKLGRHAQAIARDRHDAQSVRTRFQAVLSE